MTRKGCRRKVGQDPELTASEFEEVRMLAELYKKHRRKKLAAAQNQDLPNIVQQLARDYTARQNKFLQAAQVSIAGAEDVRVALFHANPGIEILSIKDRCITVRALPSKRLPQLPSGYCYKGGAARLALAAVLGRNVANRSPRDLDIFRLGLAPDPQDIEVARKYMPLDLKHGNGIELVKNLETYLRTRDLTFNELALMGDQLAFSFACLEDTLNGLLRPTRHVLMSSGYPQGKITMKMIRLLAESHIEGRPLLLADERPNPHVTQFDVALHLDRALSRSARAAQLYVAECVRRGLLPHDAPNLGDIIEELRSQVRGRLNQFAALRKGPARKNGAKPSLLRVSQGH